MEKLSKKRQKEENPLIHSSVRMDALEEAFDYLLALLEDHANEIELSDEEVEELANVLTEAFIERKASIMLDKKLSDINNSVQNIILRALKNYISKSEDDEDKIFDIYYYRNNLTHLSDG